MNEPSNDSRSDQRQGAQGQEAGAPAGTGNVSSVHSTPQAPEYGQRQDPEYGELATQYPGWDPYVYGKPEPPQSSEESQQSAKGDARAAAGQSAMTGNAAGSQQPQPQQSQPQVFNPYQQPQNQNANQNPMGGNRGGGNGPRFQFQQIDPNDPQQNPYYGRWDAMAVVAFVTSFFIPLLPVFLGIGAMRRTKVLHMKGRGLAIAAVVISVAQLVIDFLLMLFGINTTDLLMQQMGYVPSGGSGSGGGVDAGVTTALVE